MLMSMILDVSDFFFHPFMHLRREWQPTPVLLPGESPRTEEPGGVQSMVLQRVRYD